MAIRPTLKEFRDYITSQTNQMKAANKKATRLRRENRLRVIETPEDYACHVDVRQCIEKLDLAIIKHRRNIRMAVGFSKFLYPGKLGVFKQLVSLKN